MKRGFTLLELMVVIIIISILASLGFTQYRKVAERGRISEARYVSAQIRNAVEMYITANEDFPPDLLSLEIWPNAASVPDDCAKGTHYFTYSLDPGADWTLSYTIIADRCTANGKAPPSSLGAYNIYLNVDRTSSSSEWDDSEFEAL